MVELDQRRHRRMVKAGVSVGGQATKLVWSDGAAHERQHDPCRQFGIREARQRADFVGGKSWPAFGHI